MDRGAGAHRRRTNEHGPLGRTQSLRSFAELRKVDVGYDVPPALTFFPVPPRPAAEDPPQPGAAGRAAHDPRARYSARRWPFCRWPSSRP